MEYSSVSSSSSSSSPLSSSSTRLSPRRATLQYERTSPTGRRSPSLVYIDSIGMNSFIPPTSASSLSPSRPPLTLTLTSSHSSAHPLPSPSTSIHLTSSLSPPSSNEINGFTSSMTPANTMTTGTVMSNPNSSTVNNQTTKLSPNRPYRSPSVSPVRETGLPINYINQRRNTLPKHSTQYLTPDSHNNSDSPVVFSRSRSNSYYNRSPSRRRRRSFREPPATSASANTSPSSSTSINTLVNQNQSYRRVSAFDQDTWDSYSALIKSSQDKRKMSLPVSEPISPDWETKFINVIIVGDTNVGKYSLVRHLVDDDNNASKTRIDPNSSIDKSVNVHRLNFPLYDTHIEIIFEYYQNVTKIMDTVTDNGYKVRSMDILIVMYSVTDRRSFEMSAQYLTNAVFTCKKMNPDLSIALVANKTDLVRVREVSSEEGSSLAVKFEVPFMEVSIELDDNFESIVEWLTNVIKDKLKIGDPSQTVTSGLCATSTIKKNCTLSGRAFRFVKKILNRRGSKAKSCDNIHLM